MRHEPRDDPRPEWAKFDVERWRGSARYRTLTWGARAISTMLFVWQSQKGPILDEDGELSIAAQGAPAGEVRALLESMSDFVLVNGAWEHPVAMAYYSDAVEQIDARRRGGEARQRQSKESRKDSCKDSSKDSCQDSCKDSSKDSCQESSLIPSPSVEVGKVTVEKKPSKVTKRRTVGQQTSLALPDQQLEEALGRYFRARSLRLGGDDRDVPGGGTLTACKNKMGYLRLQGHPFELLASLPALVDTVGLVSDPTVLLRSGENARTGHDGKTYGATCHAVRIDGLLGTKALMLDEQQIRILADIGTLEWVKARGAYARKGWQ